MIVLQIELLIIPLTVLWPEILVKCQMLLWFLNIVWLAHMLISSQTLKPEETSRNPLKVALSYIKGEFIFDFLATVPSILLS